MSAGDKYRAKALEILARAETDSDPESFQPSNASFGRFPPLESGPRREGRRERHARLAERALRDIVGFAASTRVPGA